MGLQLSSIYRYPLKSTRRQALDQAIVEPWGLQGDRRWLVVDEDGSFLTARSEPRLLLITARETPDGLRLSVDPTAGVDLPELDVPAPSVDQVPVVIWRAQVYAAAAEEAAARWLSAILGRPARLVYLDDPTRRSTDPQYSTDSDRVSFADGFPLLLTTEESLSQLNHWISEGPRSAEGPLPMTRFRPNVVTSGSELAFEEDSWRRLAIGDVTFRAVKACARCVLTTIDQDRATKGKEPITTLARHRRWDGQTWFGVNLIPDLRLDQAPTAPVGVIRLGDEVRILERSESLVPHH